MQVKLLARRRWRWMATGPAGAYMVLKVGEGWCMVYARRRDDTLTLSYPSTETGKLHMTADINLSILINLLYLMLWFKETYTVVRGCIMIVPVWYPISTARDSRLILLFWYIYIALYEPAVKTRCIKTWYGRRLRVESKKKWGMRTWLLITLSAINGVIISTVEHPQPSCPRLQYRQLNP